MQGECGRVFCGCCGWVGAVCVGGWEGECRCRCGCGGWVKVGMGRCGYYMEKGGWGLKKGCVCVCGYGAGQHIHDDKLSLMFCLYMFLSLSLFLSHTHTHTHTHTHKRSRDEAGPVAIDREGGSADGSCKGVAEEVHAHNPLQAVMRQPGFQAFAGALHFVSWGRLYCL